MSHLYVLRLVFAAALVAFGLGLTSPALAESSVRPPGNAANIESAPSITAPLGGQSDSDIWRQIKEGASSAAGSGSPLIQVRGEDWRMVRRDYIQPYAGWILVGAVALIALFFVLRGRIKIEGGRAGTTIPRFSKSHRIAHWFAAITFILMSISGLLMLFGRSLAKLIGEQANSWIVGNALKLHNYLGLVFVVALLIVIVRFMRGNFFQRADLNWIAKGGGLLGGHASSHHYNFGEKSWYWIVVFVGLVMSASGLLLLFPWITDEVMWHQLSTILHVAGAILMISVALGHIYIGTIGMEGSLDSMLIGEVDENWAKAHHDLWYEEVTGRKARHGDESKVAATAQATEGAA